MLNLGPRLSEQEYSSDDRKLLDNLAAQAAPALRVGQLVRQQQAEAATRQRFEQELEVAKLIQQNFLPKQLPELSGWQVAAYYRPAREVGGDFYDVIPLPEGKVGFVVGDVTDKGVPAALVMAATRSVLRASAQRLVNPGETLERVNEHLCPDMPEKMFVTCLYGVLDPETGHFRFANAGHDLPVRQDRRRLRGAARPRHAARPHARHALRGEGDRAAARRLAAAALRRHRRGAQPRPRDVRLPAAQAVRGRLPRRRRADRPRALRPPRPHRPRRRAGGRHHHGHPPALARRGAHGQRRRAGRRAARRVRGPERGGQRAPRDRARRPPRSPASASPRAGSSASRPRSARRR